MKLSYEEKDIYIIKSKDLPKYIVGEEYAYIIIDNKEMSKGYKMKSSSFSNTILIKKYDKIYKVKKLYELEENSLNISEFLFNLEQSTLDKIYYYSFDEIESKYGLSYEQIEKIIDKYRFIKKDNSFFLLKYNIIYEIMLYYNSLIKLNEDIEEEMKIYPNFVKEWLKIYYNEKEIIIYEKVNNFLNNIKNNYDKLLSVEFIPDYIKDKIKKEKLNDKHN